MAKSQGSSTQSRSIVTINVSSSYLQAVECHETAGLIFLQVSQQMYCFHSWWKIQLYSYIFS